MADTCPFLGPLVPLFWISGDVSSGFQSQSGFCLIRYFCGGECNVHSPRFTSGATLANLLAAGAQPVTSPHACAEVGLGSVSNMHAWSKINFKTPYGSNQIEEEFICMNSWIRINKEPIPLKPNWPVKIKDIVNEDGKFISFANLKPIYTGLTWLDYIGIQKALPDDWKDHLKCRTM